MSGARAASPSHHDDRAARDTSRPTGEKAKKGRSWWSGRVARYFGIAFLVFVLCAVAYAASQVQWAQVWTAIQDKPPAMLAGAFAIGVASHLLYSTYDLIGRRWVGHSLSARQVMQTAFVSYVFNLNLGSLIGGVGMRLRLYQRLGLENDRIARVIGLALATNWLSYAAVAGVLFAVMPINLPADWKVGTPGLRVIGVVAIALVIAYVVACARSEGRTFTVRGHSFTLPPWRMALAQLALGAANWMTIGAMLYVLLGQTVPYPQVLGVFMLGALAGILMRVPAGLGVLEAVFVTLVATAETHHAVLASVLAYRALYYLIPLGVGALLYLSKEMRPHASTPAD